MGNVHYKEDMPLAIHNRVRGDGRGTWVGPHTPGWAPREEWPLQVSQGKLWLPAPGPSLPGMGVREEGMVGQQLMWESSAPPPKDSFTRTISPQVLAPGGQGRGTHFLPAPRCPAQVTEGSRPPIPAV